jgi:2,3-dihydroxybenzoate-AMP ligase
MNLTPASEARPAPLVAFPPEKVSEYLHSGMWLREPLAQQFRATAERYPGRPALVCGPTEWTYRELDRAADRRAAGLLGMGFRPGEPVLLQVGNSAETVLTWYALLKAGLVPVCTLPQHRRHEIQEISRQTQPTAHIVDAEAGRFDLVSFALEQSEAADRPRRVLTQSPASAGRAIPLDSVGAGIADSDARRIVDSVQAQLTPEDIAVFQLSGGTTGVPKVIPRLHGEYWYNAARYAEFLTWTCQDRVAYIGPVVHNAGTICGLHGPHAVGAAALLGTPDLASLFSVLTEHRATDVVLGPFAYEAALDPRMAARHGLRRVLFSGKKVPAAHFDALTGRGVWVGQLFGMGEGLSMITPLDAPAEVRARSVGIPISPGDEVRVLHPDGETEVADGQTGELCARGPYTLRGYYNAPEHNRRAFTADGFYRTGDLVARRTIAGRTAYTMEGRIKDLVNRGGEKVNAEEVESLLMRHPRIVEAAVVAMPDERLGERACAFASGGTEPVTLGEVQAFLDSLGVAKYKWPERLEWLDEMPRASQVGKIDKKVLRQRATLLRADRGQRPGTVPPAEPAPPAP